MGERMISKLKDTPTPQDLVDGLDDLFADLLKSKSSQPKSGPNHDLLLSKFLDEEMEEKKPERLSPDLDQKLADALREIGLDSSLRDITTSGKTTPKNEIVAESPIQPVNKEPSFTVPATLQMIPPLTSAKPLPNGVPTLKKTSASTIPVDGKAKGMATTAKSNPPYSIMSSTSSQTSGGSRKKPVVFGLIGLAAVGTLAFYFISGTKNYSPLPVNMAQVGGPITPSVSSSSAEKSARGMTTLGSGTISSKPSSLKTDPAPASQQDPKIQNKPGLAAGRPATPISGVATWSVTESLGNSQSLPTPATSVVRGPDMPTPVAMTPNATAPVASSLIQPEPAILMTPPRPISKVSPIVPEMVRKLKISGSVKINAKVDEKGRVTSAVAESGPAMLRNSAEGAVRQWKFKPAQSNGTPVASETSILIEYK